MEREWSAVVGARADGNGNERKKERVRKSVNDDSAQEIVTCW